MCVAAAEELKNERKKLDLHVWKIKKYFALYVISFCAHVSVCVCVEGKKNADSLRGGGI